MKNNILLCVKRKDKQAITKIASDHECEIIAPIDQGDDPEAQDNCDVVIDFSLADATLPLRLLRKQENQWLLEQPDMKNLLRKKL